MSLVKPIASIKNAFDATKEEMFSFTSVGGDRVVANRLTIINQTTQEVVYSERIESFRFEHTLPSNTLENGVYYNYYFNTYDIDGVESLNSNTVSFYCYSTPQITITNMPLLNQLETSNYTFNFKYEQAEGELVDVLTFKLYDTVTNNLVFSNNIYSREIGSLGLYSQYIGGLENNTDYYIIISGVTVNGTKFQNTATYGFHVQYAYSGIYSQLLLENRCDKGYIEIKSNFVIAEGEMRYNPPVFVENNSKLDVLPQQNYVQWTSGFNIPSNFTIGIWGKIGENGEFFRMWNENGDKIVGRMLREKPYGTNTPKDCFDISVYSSEGLLVGWGRSNYIDLLKPNDNYLAFIQKKDDIWSLVLNQISASEFSLVWGQSTNTFFGQATPINWNNTPQYSEGIDSPNRFTNIDDMFSVGMTAVRLSNGIYGHINISTDVTLTPETFNPTWTFYTKLDCDFNGNLHGGNTELVLADLKAVRLKRRDTTTDYGWINLKEVQVHSIDDINFIYQDSLVPSGVEQEYCLVPVDFDNKEGEYIPRVITPKWGGVYLTIGNVIHKLYSGVTYNGFTQNRQIGTLLPLGQQYPVINQNAATHYLSGSIQGNILGYNYETTNIIDRNNIVKEFNDIIAALDSGECMCITDWNGNIWLARVSGNDSIAYNQIIGNGLITIAFNFVEQGKYNVQEDLYRNGFVERIESGE